MSIKVRKAIKRTYTVGPYETIHIESSIEKEVDNISDESLEALKSEVEEVVIKDFISYKDHVFDVVENNATERHNHSEKKDIRDSPANKNKNEEFQSSLFRDE